MKRTLLLILLLSFSQVILAQNEIEPEGGKLIWFFLILVLAVVLFLLFGKKGKKTNTTKNPLFVQRKIKIELDKDQLYYPDNLTLTVKNTGNTDLDLDRPLLILDNFWLKRKFKLKGMGNRSFYPLYLEKGITHTLQIDLNRFYSHDKSLKKFPKAKVIIFNVKGKRIGSKSVYLRKTLFKF